MAIWFREPPMNVSNMLIDQIKSEEVVVFPHILSEDR
jgi:hypothetical protein